jgi:hypothetical protein
MKTTQLTRLVLVLFALVLLSAALLNSSEIKYGAYKIGQRIEIVKNRK